MMGYRFLLAICIVLVVLAQCASVAVPVDDTKYIQPPKMDLSYDFSSELKTGFVMADDWLCADGKPVTDIHWWGSYWNPLAGNNYTIYSDMRNNAPSGGISGFAIGIFSDVAVNNPNNQVGFSHPGDLLATYEFQGNCNETYYGTVVKSTTPSVTEDVYEYSVNLIDTRLGPFMQDQGSIYWLAIGANLPDVSKQWGWHESSIHWNDYAVQGVGGEISDWYIPCGGHDMSFALTTVPEPGSLLALGSGLIGFVGFAFRRRKS